MSESGFELRLKLTAIIPHPVHFFPHCFHVRSNRQMPKSDAYVVVSIWQMLSVNTES